MKTVIIVVAFVILALIVLIKTGIVSISFSISDFRTVIGGRITQFGLVIGHGDPGEDKDGLMALYDEPFYVILAIGPKQFMLMILITPIGG